MSMISYAQNFEDVMLWRALGHIDNGFYIDVGANDPVVDSVSLAFYKKGWRGVHVEPVPSLVYSISKSRPDESLEQAAVGTNEGKIIFYEVEGTGLSTAEEKIAARHRESGFKVFEREVECITLDNIFEKYHKNEIHWLKIDVEGREKDVLKSWHVSEARPWIIVVESTVPLSGEENFQDWEAGLCDKGYSFVYFDGLNRFYLHETHANLQRHFNVPPNVFDNFVLSESNWMCAHIIERKKQLEESEEHLSRLDSEIKNLRTSLEHLELEHSRSESRAARAEAAEEALSQQLEDVFLSRSWRITSPMRWSGHQLSLLRQHGVKSRLNALARKLAIGLIQYSNRHARLRHWLVSLAQHLGVKEQLKVVYHRCLNNDLRGNINATPKVPLEVAHLGPHARQVYQDMKQVIERQGGGQ
ncbi:methyltransferase FkbM family protein [Alcanivorax balearicus MACL04]|uniref:Methyltransferase FkbM family protein n=1 Tax=Alloalcanivorax balearicus MACL04 TaxID=1177182 RepID=A0ABT2R0Y7_9GAMM|nr:FkbM family methyltransferase [Alloalcanivorax balearicus]MCU5783445.1 methyltransferase FkbM family protein [Alloalcanivorax balearicus MACL04]